MNSPAEPTAQFERHRGLLFGIAYRMTGSVSEAEDVVQETWLRWRDAADVDDPRAWLVTVTSRLCLDLLRSARVRREQYVGPWLPEPLVTGPEAGDRVELAESLSMALLVVLESLSPAERAVFVLREAFGFSHAEIAAALGRAEPAVRQMARRARAHVSSRRPRFDSDDSVVQQVTERFLAAAVGGDLDELLAVLAPDVTLVSDGGGVVTAARKPVEGADRVARFLVGVGRAYRPSMTLRRTQINGAPGLRITDGRRTIVVMSLDVAGDRIQAIHVVLNPDKLVELNRRLEAQTKSSKSL